MGGVKRKTQLIVKPEPETKRTSDTLLSGKGDRGLSKTSGSGSACVYAADHEGDRGSRIRNGSGCGSLHTSAGPFLAACSAETFATHHLLRGVLFRVVPRKVIPRQPAARVDNGDTQHVSVARRARAGSMNARLGPRFAQDGFVNDDLGKRNHFF